MRRQQLIYDFVTGHMTLVYKDGTSRRIPCHKLKVILSHSEFSSEYWPRKKSDRMKVKAMIENGEERPNLDTFNTTKSEGRLINSKQ